MESRYPRRFTYQEMAAVWGFTAGAATSPPRRPHLPQLPGASSTLLPSLRSSEQMCRGGGQLGPVGRFAGADPVYVVDTGHLHVPHAPEKVALVANQIERHAAGAHMPEVLHVVLRRP